MGHDIDLRGDRIAAPHDDQVGLRHFARVRPAIAAHAGKPSSLANRGADGQFLARIAHCVAQPVDAVALHQPHRAGVIERPHRFRPVPRRRVHHRRHGAVQRLVPADLAELAGAFRASPQKRPRQPIRMMDPFCITRDLRADHAGRVAVVGCTVHRPDTRAVQYLHFQRAGGGAVVRADRGADLAGHGASCDNRGCRFQAVATPRPTSSCNDRRSPARGTARTCGGTRPPAGTPAPRPPASAATCAWQARSSM